MANEVTIYGIKNCDTMKRARAWLDAKAIAYVFHDYKSSPPTRELLRGWSARADWQALLNRAGTTFRKLAEADKAGLDRDKAIALMLAYPSAIKRPVLDTGGTLIVGFKTRDYEAAFA